MTSAVSRPSDRNVTAELLARHDRPGPRYTSYPTAIEFTEDVDVATYEQHLARANALRDDPLSIYIHLPFCEHRCLFCGCHVIVTPHKKRALPYMDMLLKEIDLIAAQLPHRRKISQLHLGGGTPTYSPPHELDRILSHLFTYFERAPGAELAVEVDPRVTSREHLDTLAKHGFNRISLGVQDFTPRVQETIERVQSVEQTRDLIEHARSLGFRGVNVDLIYGLPFQEIESFERTIDIVLDLEVDRAAVYSFAFVPWIRGNQRSIQEEDLPAAEEKVALFAMARERFLNAGYEPIGMDHFARPDDELARAKREGRLRRNFQGYTVIPADDVIGLGISAIGDVRGGYFQNTKTLAQYERSVNAGELPLARGVTLSPDDELRRYVIHQLMCNGVIEVADVERRYDIRFAEIFEQDLARLALLVPEGLVTITSERIEATPVGEMFIRNLAMCFDIYWREKHEGGDKPVFSRTV